MKAVVIEQFGDLSQVKMSDVPAPELQPNEVQIQVAYAGVNPVDWKIGEGYLRELLPHQLPIVLGWDVSGKITKVGSEVTNFKVGDEVFAYARKLVVKWGTYAEEVCVEAKNVVLKPAKLSLKEAAAIPLVSLTAWQALVDSAKLKEGETVLIHAGGGGVGGVAIQIAKHLGAKVITTASPKHHEYVKKFGADHIIDYTQGNFADKVKEIAPEGVDVVLDTVGDEALDHSIKLLKKGGRIASIRQQIDPSTIANLGIKAGFVFVKPSGTQLKTIADLIDSGKIKAPAVEEFPFDKFKEALEKVKEGHVQGKVVLKIK